MSTRAFLALGSNIDPARRLPEAVTELAKYGTVRAVSAVYQSPPADGSDQPDYCNAAVLLATRHGARALQETVIPAVEAAGDRVRDPADRFAPRTIDVDLVCHGDVVIEGPDGITLPDVNALADAFVAVPLAELDPDYVVPRLGRTLREIAETVRAEASLTPRPDIVLRY